MKKYHFYILIIFACSFALAYRWFSKPTSSIPLQQKKIIAIKTPSEPRPFKYTAKQAPAPTLEKEDMKMKIIKAQADDPSFLPFDNEGNIYIENVIIDEDWAIAHGDLLVGNAQELMQLERDGASLHLAKPQFWKDGIVPYTLHNSLRPEQKNAITSVMQLLSATSNLKFIEATGETDHLLFRSGGQHCYSFVGRVGGAQDVVLGPDCKEPQILHEVMHSLGFYHEQSRIDRDEFIMIMWENIEEQFHEQFKKIPPLHYSIDSIDFDLASIMMYPPQAFSRSPSEPSILTINGEFYRPKQTLSAGDILKIESIYGKK